MPDVTRGEALRAAGVQRGAAVAQRTHRPGQRRDHADARLAHRSPDRAAAAASAPMRAQLDVTRAAGSAADDVTLTGYATTYEQPYEMYDYYGPYTEVVTAGAGETSLAAGPDVKFFYDHRGAPMARTLQAETLELSEDDHGLLSVARPNMRLDVSRTTVELIDSHLVDEMSFAFVIVRGLWSPDWTEYRIHEYDIHRGDTSAVGYGANPTTEIEAERGATAAADRTLTLSGEQRQRARRVLAGFPPA